MADDVLRRQLAEALRKPNPDRAFVSYAALVDALLPVVEHYAAEAAARALGQAAEDLDEYAAHAATEAREWAPDTYWVTSWEGKQSAYAWSAKLLRDRAGRAQAGERQ